MARPTNGSFTVKRETAGDIANSILNNTDRFSGKSNLEIEETGKPADNSIPQQSNVEQNVGNAANATQINNKPENKPQETSGLGQQPTSTTNDGVLHKTERDKNYYIKPSLKDMYTERMEKRSVQEFNPNIYSIPTTDTKQESSNEVSDFVAPMQTYTPVTETNEKVESTKFTASRLFNSENKITVPKKIKQPEQKQEEPQIVEEQNDNDNILLNGVEPLQEDEITFQPRANVQPAVKQQKQISNTIQKWNGNNFTEKVGVAKKIDPEAMSIGSEIINEIVREPVDNFLQIINELTGETFTPEQLSTSNGMKALINTVKKNKVYAIATRPSQPLSEAQVRRVYIHEGRGVLVHRTQARIYNIGFEGDDVSIQFVNDDTPYKNAMSFLIGEDGIVNIDTEFFPISPINDNKTEFAKYVNKVIFKDFPFEKANKTSEEIANALFAVAHPHLFKDKTTNDLWVNLINEMQEVANRFRNPNRVMSDMIRNLYDRMLLTKQINAEAIYETSADIFDNTWDNITSSGDQYVQMILNDISIGVLPPNYQDFVATFSKSIGSIDRDTSTRKLGEFISRKINFTGEFTIGNMEQVYKAILTSGLSKFLNGKSFIGEKIKFINGIIKNYMITNVGFPAEYKTNGELDIKKYLTAFRDEFNTIVRIVKAASIDFTCDLDAHYKSSENFYELDENIMNYGRAMALVYSDYTVKKIFDRTYQNMTVGQFSTNNTYSALNKNRQYHGQPIPKTISEIEPGKKSEAAFYALYIATANQRIKLSDKFNRDLRTMLEDHVKVFNEIEKLEEKLPYDFNGYAAKLMDIVHISGPDMFDYYQMMPFDNFMQSYYGKKLKAASKKKDADLLGGIRMSMLFRYRMRHIENLNQEIENIQNSNEVATNKIPRINKLKKDVEYEAMLLASSSLAWKTIIREIRNGNKYFNELKNNNGKFEGINFESIRFWRTTKYESIVSVLLDTDIPMSKKCSVLSDLVKMSSLLFNVKGTDIPYQLEIGSRSSKESTTTMAYTDQPSAITNIQSSINKTRDFFTKGIEDTEYHLANAIVNIKPGDIDSVINKIGSSSQAYSRINIRTIADAINALGYNDAAPLQNFYESLLIQHGGYINQQYKSGDRLLGKISERDLTRYDLIQVLSNKDFSIKVYNENGEWTLSRENLCMADDESSLFDFLFKSPEIANLVLRNYITTNDNGITREVADGNIEDFFMQDLSQDTIVSDQIFSEIINRPIFVSMCALYYPSGNKSPRANIETRVKVIDNLFRIILNIGINIKNGNNIDIDNILNQMDTSPESIQKIGEIREDIASDIYSNIYREIIECSAIAAETFRKNDLDFQIDLIDNIEMSFDKNSIILYLDTLKVLSSIKPEPIEMDYPINQRNIGMILYCAAQNDKYMMIDDSLEEDEIAGLIGCRTNEGIITADNLNDLIELADEDNGLFVELPEKMVALDENIDTPFKQVNSLLKFISHRNSGDANSDIASSNDYGDLNVIVDTDRYSAHAISDVQDIMDAYAINNDLFEARRILAEKMFDNDRSEGYKDLSIADYMNIASIMIKERTNEENNSYIEIMSIEQIAYKIEQKMTRETIESKDINIIINEAIDIAESPYSPSGQELITNLALADIVSKIDVPSQGEYMNSTNNVSSGEREFNEIWKMSHKESIVFPWNGETVDKPEKRILSETEAKELHNEIINTNQLFGKINNKTKFRLSGLVSNENSITRINPDPSSVWFVENSASEDQVESAIKNCYAYGMSLAFEESSVLGKFKSTFQDEIVPAPFDIGNSIYMIPFYQIRLNGSSLDPVSPPSFQYDPKSIVVNVEDSDNFYGLARGEVLASNAMKDRINIRQNGLEPIPLSNIFTNTFTLYQDQIANITFAMHEDVEKYIVNKLNDYVIDFPENYSKEKQDLMIQEYVNNFNSSDEFGVLKEGHPDRIIAWLKCQVYGYDNPIFAPVIPFANAENAPTSFNIGRGLEDIHIDQSTKILYMPWTIKQDLKGQYIRIQNGELAGGEGLVFTNGTKDLGRLDTGRYIDFITATTREAKSNEYSARMSTMKTLALFASLPPFGYNYAEHNEAFPDNPDIKEILITNRLERYEWYDLSKKISRYSNDPEIDAFLKRQINLALKTTTINPSDILATKFNNLYSFRYVDHDFMFDNKIEFQNALMKFYSSMIPELCPSGIYEEAMYNGKPTIFRVCLDDGYEYGCLQMRVPFMGERRNIIYKWTNVYASLSSFITEYSGMKRINIDHSDRTIQRINAAIANGKMPTNEQFSDFINNAFAKKEKAYGPKYVESDYGRFIRKAEQ